MRFTTRSIQELISNLESRMTSDRGKQLERYYRYLPSALARLVERSTMPRHMRAMHPMTSLRHVSGTEWEIFIGSRCLARTSPLDQLLPVNNAKVLMVATGPTAADYDWSNARSSFDFILALNGATTFLAEKGVRPDLHLIVDRPFLEKGRKHLDAASAVPLITNYSGLSSVAALMPDLVEDRSLGMVEKVNSWYGMPRFEFEELRRLNAGDDRIFHFSEHSDDTYRIGWSEYPEYGYFSGSTVAFLGLQLLVRYGAAEIDIVGMDFSAAGHVYKDDMKTAGKLAGQYDSVLLPSFKLMSEALVHRSVCIRNLSPVCPLPGDLFPG